MPLPKSNPKSRARHARARSKHGDARMGGNGIPGMRALQSDTKRELTRRAIMKGTKKAPKLTPDGKYEKLT